MAKNVTEMLGDPLSKKSRKQLGGSSANTSKRDKKNRKLAKRLDKQINRVEKLVTKMLQLSTKLQTIRGVYKNVGEKKAA